MRASIKLLAIGKRKINTNISTLGVTLKILPYRKAEFLMKTAESTQAHGWDRTKIKQHRIAMQSDEAKKTVEAQKNQVYSENKNKKN